jgi:hypothetical protein
VFARIAKTLKIWRDFLTRNHRASFRERVQKLFRKQEDAKDAAEKRRRDQEEGGGP